MGCDMNFEEMSKIDVSMHTEKKGKFTYLSWPYAVAEFRKACPNGSWQIESYGDSKQPYCVTDSGCFVTVTVTPDMSSPYVNFSQVHPVLDYKNKTVKEPDAFQVNTSIQRCLVKAIALATGIGLYIYAGEDLPPGSGKKEVADYVELMDMAQDYEDLKRIYQDNLEDMRRDGCASEISAYNKQLVDAAGWNKAA